MRLDRACGLGAKRLFDILASILALGCLSIPLAIAVFLILSDDGGPVFFLQERVGKNGKAFMIYKFRTMVRDAERIGKGVFTEADDPRITRIGRWLRRWSIDELPQLLNVLKGDMSLVGPRPTLPYQVTKYDLHERQRLAMRPGISGWAQVNGRNSLSWPEKIELDVWYVNHWSLWLDIVILFRTLLVIVGGESVYGQTPDAISSVGKGTTDM